LNLIKWKRKAKIKSAKSRTAAACGALSDMQQKRLIEGKLKESKESN
jgi:hypothetical protein